MGSWLDVCNGFFVCLLLIWFSLKELLFKVNIKYWFYEEFIGGEV